MNNNKKTYVITFILLTVLSMSVGCASPYSAKPLSTIKLFRQRTENALNSSKPGQDAQQYLRLKFLDKKYHNEPESVILELLQISRETKDTDAMIATAELSLLQARKTFNSDRDASAEMYVTAAEVAYDYLLAEASATDNALKPSYRFMTNIYNRSVSRLVEIREKKDNPWEGSQTFELFDTAYEFSVETNGPGIWNPNIFDSLRPANQIQVKGFRNEYLIHGLGASLVGLVDKPRQHPDFGKYYPAKGLAYPLTAILIFDPLEMKAGKRSRKIRIVFYDPLSADTVTIADRKVSLEADFSTPLGVLLAKIQPQRFGLDAMFKSDEYLSRSGMYLLEPYRPEKIPVVMVHGLMSSPETWVEMFNDLRGDPELRSRCQFWFFMYPTGLPILYSGSLLRNELNEIRSKFDPDNNNPYFEQMVLIGHSMGGLLSRQMVQDSGDTYWSSVFTEPIETIKVDDPTRELLQNIFYFKPLPFVKRVVFAASPHKGSDLADIGVARFFAGFISLPDIINDTADSLFARKDIEFAFDHKEPRKIYNSIELLSPNSRFIVTTNKIPLNPNIPYHSIIGTRRDKEGPGSSDGIVPYESSHLDFTVSEKLVPSGHEAQKHPLAIDEVKRILKLHLESRKAN